MDQVDAPQGRYDYEQAGSHAKGSLRLWLRLFSCATLVESEISRRLRTTFDVSLAKFDFMAQLYRAPDGGMTMSQLGRCLMVTGGNITGLTDRMEKEGLCARRPHPSDRRSQLIGLTRKGRLSFEAMAQTHEDWINELIGDLDDAVQERIMRQLGDLKHTVLTKLDEGRA